jgi:hypothetical protein
MNPKYTELFEEIGITKLHFETKAHHIEGTEFCAVVLPCKFKDKQVEVNEL